MFPQSLTLPLQVAKGVVSLWPWFTVSIAHSSSKKFAIQLTTSEQVLFLAANTLSLMNKWLYHIQTQQLLDPPKKGAPPLPLFSLTASLLSLHSSTTAPANTSVTSLVPRLSLETGLSISTHCHRVSLFPLLLLPHVI